ncbi:MAG: hypothetical protein ACT4OK_03075 [Gemmobacter sp.]
MVSISPLLFCVGLLTNLFAVRFAGYFLPDRMYFSFSAFLFDTRDLDKPTAIAAKLAVPFLVSLVLTLVLFRIRKMQQSVAGPGQWAEVVLDSQVAITLTFSATFCAVLMAWPYILLWDMLIDPALAPERLTFLFAYTAYFVATGFFAMAGANTAIALSQQTYNLSNLTLQSLSQRAFVRPVLDALTGTASAAIATLIALQTGGE